jgi:5-methylcytosine-specific restriction protein B
MQITASALLPYPERVMSDVSIIERISSLWRTEKKFLVLAGPPGTGKTRAAEDYISRLIQDNLSSVDIEGCRLSSLFPEFRTKVYSAQEIRDSLQSNSIQFVWDLAVLHPQYSYEDLIRGFRAEPAKDGGISLVVREGLLGFAARVGQVLETLDRAGSNEPKCVVILDEINRAPIGQLFGEAIYALDRRASKVVTPYPLGDMGPTISIPKSLLILGTMNSIDRATSGFDFALRRRFANIPILPSRVPVESFWKKEGGQLQYGVKLFDLVRMLVKSSDSVGNVPASELMLGHSYFLPPLTCATEEAQLAWLYTSYVYQMLPTLQDYVEQGLLSFKDSELAKLPLGNRLDSAACSALNYEIGIELFKESLSNVETLPI